MLAPGEHGSAHCPADTRATEDKSCVACGACVCGRTPKGCCTGQDPGQPVTCCAECGCTAVAHATPPGTGAGKAPGQPATCCAECGCTAVAHATPQGTGDGKHPGHVVRAGSGAWNNLGGKTMACFAEPGTAAVGAISPSARHPSRARARLIFLFLVTVGAFALASGLRAALQAGSSSAQPLRHAPGTTAFCGAAPSRSNRPSMCGRHPLGGTPSGHSLSASPQCPGAGQADALYPDPPQEARPCGCSSAPPGGTPNPPDILMNEFIIIVMLAVMVSMCDVSLSSRLSMFDSAACITSDSRSNDAMLRRGT